MPTRVTFQRKRRTNYRKKPQYPLNPRQKVEVKKMIQSNIELKSFDEALGGVTVSDTPIIARWFAITQGVGNTQRIGNQINCKYMQLKYQMSAGDNTNIMRYIVFQWREDNLGNAPSVDDILYRGANSNPWTNALYNYDNRHQYTILYDRRHQLDYDNPTDTFGGSNYLKIKHKKMDYPIPAAITGTNAIYILVVSDSAAGNHPIITNQGRLYYYDA